MPPKTLIAALSTALLGLLLAPGASAEREPGFSAGKPLTMELKRARWFDGREFRHGTLYIQDGRFTAKRPRRPDRRMELDDQFLIAPLAEANNNNLQYLWGFEQFRQRYIQDGVFYASMQCGNPAGVAPVRQAQARQPVAPDVRFVTACVTSSDGQPLGALLAAQPQPRLEDLTDKALLMMDTPEQVARKWPLLAQRKTDRVRLVLSYSEMPELRADPANFGNLGVSPEVAAAVVERAHRDGLRVIAHVETAADFAAAVQSGVDRIAHLPGFYFRPGSGPERYLISADVAQEAARRKVEVVTGTAATGLFKLEPERLSLVRQTQRQNLTLLREAGVKLLLGSDVFMATALAEWHSLAELGVFEPAELLRMASVDTPQALFPERRLGCFAPGCEASFLVLPANPLEDAGALDRIQLRVKQGRLIKLQP